MQTNEVATQIASAFAAGDMTKANNLVRQQTVAATREYFLRTLVLEDIPGQPPSVVLDVKDWKDLKLFMQELPTQQHNPGGPLFEQVILDAQQCIEEGIRGNGDPVRFLGDLLLILKAVRRV